MENRKVSDFARLSNKKTWDDTETVSLSDIVPTNLTITEFARVMYGNDTAYAFKTHDGKEFVSVAIAFVNLGNELVASEAVKNTQSHAEYTNTTIYELAYAIDLRVERKKSASTGREFYYITDVE